MLKKWKGIWNAIEDWNSEHKREDRVYVFLHTPNFSNVKKGECVSKELRVSFSKSVNSNTVTIFSDVFDRTYDSVMLSNLLRSRGVKYSDFGKDIVIDCEIKAEKMVTCSD